MQNWLNSTITKEHFLAEYWQKKPLLIRHAFPNITPLIPADELAGLACEGDVESRLITQSPDQKQWQLQHGPFTDEIFAELPESHWTLLVQAVDHWLPEAAAFLKEFNLIPNWRMDDLMISYASDGGGVGPHYDHYDVFLIQASGQRRWEIGGTYDDKSPRRDDTPVLILNDWSPQESWILSPGDMLYVPPQIGHNGIANGNDCMTYSVGFRAPSQTEMLSGFTDYIIDTLNETKHYSDPDLTLQSNPGEITANVISNIYKELNELLNDREKIIHWFGQMTTLPKYAEAPPAIMIDCTPENIQQHLQSGGSFVAAEGSRFAFIAHEKNSRKFFVDGQTFHTSSETFPLIDQLCQYREVTGDILIATQAELQLLSKLVQQNSLYPLLPSD